MPGSRGATVLDDLPESIVVEEILVRLPPKDLLRCRAVCKYWHSATSTDKFMLDHHGRQPVRPILAHAFGVQMEERLFVFHDAGASQHKLCPFFRYSHDGRFHAALDGLLIASEYPKYFICNPVTRKCARLWTPKIQSYFYNDIAGFYRHQSSGEYRILWVIRPTPYINYTTSYYVIAVGSYNPRCVRKICISQRTMSTPYLEVALQSGHFSSTIDPPVYHRGSLHWKLGKPYLMVFNIAAETFWLMRSPSQQSSREVLLDMDGTLAFSKISSSRNTIDVWVIQDYAAEIWSFKHRINLSGLDTPSLSNAKQSIFPNMVVVNEGELLIQFPPKRVLRYGIDGKFLGYVKNQNGQVFRGWITKHYLQESVIPLPLIHEMIEEDGASQEPPFFIGL